MRQDDASGRQSLVRTASAVALAGLLGLAGGALVARVSRPEDFSWCSLLVLPLWMLLEIFFEAIAATLGYFGKTNHVAVGIALVAGFYVAMFASR